MRSQLSGYVALLVIALGAAYYASNPTEVKGDMAQEWFSVKPSEIKAIRYQDAKVEVTIEPMDFGYWVNVNEKKKQADGTEKDEHEAFKASPEMKSVEEELNPFMALRTIGSAKGQNLADYGLQELDKKLVVESKSGSPLTLALGKKSYGSRDSFVLDETKQEVILASGLFLDQVRNARTRLFERDVVKVEDDRVKKATVTMGGKSARWDHSERDASGGLIWRDDKEGATAQAAYRNWVDKVYKTKVMSFPSLEEQKRIATLKPFLEITFSGDRGEIDKVIYVKEGEDKYYATSTSLKIWASVNPSRMIPIEKDIESIFKGG